MDYIKNKCNECISCQDNFESGNCSCTNDNLTEDQKDIKMGLFEWSDMCPGFKRK
jgi:hypothetical protein